MKLTLAKSLKEKKLHLSSSKGWIEKYRKFKQEKESQDKEIAD